MSKSEDMRRLIDLANNNKIISESHGDGEFNPFKTFSSWNKISEAVRVNGTNIFKNPSRSQLETLTMKTPDKYMRGLQNGNDHYWWNGSEAIHAQAADALGIPFDYRDRLESTITRHGDHRIGADIHGTPASLKIPRKNEIEDLAKELATEEGVTEAENTPEWYYPDVREKYSEEQLLAFKGLSDAQRGKPEAAMLAAQRVLGKYPSGNLYGNLLEHIGDLTNRMANPHHIGATFGKLDKLSNLNNPVDIERMSKIPDTPEAEAYSKAHEALPVYNEAQRLARDAAVALGRKDFKTVTVNLTILKKMKDAGVLEIESGKYDPNFERSV